MKRFTSIFGYIWAIMAIPFAFAIFSASNPIYKSIFEANGIKVSDRITGGEVRHSIQREEYTIHLHKPVFDGFFIERNSGFVQVDFVSEEELPLHIEEEIDYDADGNSDFFISINTQSNEYELIPKREEVGHLSEEEVFVLENRRTIRVELKK